MDKFWWSFENRVEERSPAFDLPPCDHAFYAIWTNVKLGIIQHIVFSLMDFIVADFLRIFVNSKKMQAIIHVPFFCWRDDSIVKKRTTVMIFIVDASPTFSRSHARSLHFFIYFIYLIYSVMKEEIVFLFIRTFPISALRSTLSPILFPFLAVSFILKMNLWFYFIFFRHIRCYNIGWSVYVCASKWALFAQRISNSIICNANNKSCWEHIQTHIYAHSNTWQTKQMYNKGKKRNNNLFI